MLSEKQETAIKDLLTWQKNQVLTWDLSRAMEARQDALKTELGRPLSDVDLMSDSAWSALKVQHDSQAAQCETPRLNFEKSVKEV